MTDEQIIQAVDLCANAQEDCRKCPLHSVYSANCIKKLMNNTLDLIKRQKAEIERLEADREALINGQITLQKMYAEAIKKFADLFKQQMRDCACAEFDGIKYYLIGEEFVNRRLKEMTEGK